MTKPLIRSIDHFVLTVADVETTVAFYTRVLGMRAETFDDGRRALCFASQKINLHQAGREFEPKARVPTPGSGDFCLLSDAPVGEIAERLKAEGVEVILGPAMKTGATGPLTSIYFRDPDGNLIEVSNEA